MSGAIPYELTKWGLRFVDAQTEADYRLWQRESTVPFIRIGMVAAMFNFLGAGLVAKVSNTEVSSLFFSIFVFFLGPCAIGGVVLTLYRGARGALIPYVFVTNVLTGVVFQWGTIVGAWRDDLGIAATIIAAFFSFTVFRLRPWPAAFSTGIYLLIAAGVAIRDAMLGVHDMNIGVARVVLPVVTFGTGILACAVLDRVSRQNFRQGRILDEQTRVIDQERQRADDLLHNILPLVIVNRLKERPGIIAERFDQVTVLFADVVGFTPFAASTTPEQLVHVLNDVFTMFDGLATKFGVEKIKTIGDAYMAVAGVPTVQTEHAAAAAEFALAMQEAVETLPASMTNSHRLRIRIGLCSGPVVAGVIGRQKFAYDLWGDTVNTAARMEAHGVAGEVHTTESVYELLKDRYEFKERGIVEIKGKGAMRTFFLVGKKPVDGGVVDVG